MTLIIGLTACRKTADSFPISTKHTPSFGHSGNNGYLYRQINLYYHEFTRDIGPPPCHPALRPQEATGPGTGKRMYQDGHTGPDKLQHAVVGSLPCDRQSCIRKARPRLPRPAHRAIGAGDSSLRHPAGPSTSSTPKLPGSLKKATSDVMHQRRSRRSVSRSGTPTTAK